LHGDTKVSETELTGGGEAVVSLLENVGNVFSFEQANASRQEDSQPMSDSKAIEELERELAEDEERLREIEYG
jgi:membrane protein involved in colicin uptake